VREFLIRRRVGRLATTDPRGRPHVVPVCYVLLDDQVYSPLDEKPKSVEVEQLARVRNLRAHPSAALVVDDYADDWAQLAYVLVRGAARIVPIDQPEHARAVRELRAKYPQYRTMAIDRVPMICLSVDRVHAWAMRDGYFQTS
jgi:PPOX class probable F420-dependent enzyme